MHNIHCFNSLQEEESWFCKHVMDVCCPSKVQDLHPIDFLDEVGEVICDLTGTCVDLFAAWSTEWLTSMILLYATFKG